MAAHLQITPRCCGSTRQAAAVGIFCCTSSTGVAFPFIFSTSIHLSSLCAGAKGRKPVPQQRNCTVLKQRRITTSLIREKQFKLHSAELDRAVNKLPKLKSAELNKEKKEPFCFHCLNLSISRDLGSF